MKIKVEISGYFRKVDEKSKCQVCQVNVRWFVHFCLPPPQTLSLHRGYVIFLLCKYIIKTAMQLITIRTHLSPPPHCTLGSPRYVTVTCHSTCLAPSNTPATSRRTGGNEKALSRLGQHSPSGVSSPTTVKAVVAFPLFPSLKRHLRAGFNCWMKTCARCWFPWVHKQLSSTLETFLNCLLLSDSNSCFDLWDKNGSK